MASLGADSAGVAEPGLKLRSYQQEMLEASLKRNVIVVVSTIRTI